MSWQRPEPETPRFISIWEPLPDGYNPVAPIMAESVTLSVPLASQPLMMSGPNSLPPFRDPRVGVFVPHALPPTPVLGSDGRYHPPHLLDGNNHFRAPATSYTTHAFAIGRDRIGDANARIGGDRITPIHGELPTGTTQTRDPYNEVILP